MTTNMSPFEDSYADPRNLDRREPPFAPRKIRWTRRAENLAVLLAGLAISLGLLVVLPVLILVGA